MPKGITASIVCASVEPTEDNDWRDRAWFAEFLEGKKMIRLRVTKQDAWDRDVFIGLPVSITKRPEGWCHIVARLKDRKKFVCSGK